MPAAPESADGSAESGVLDFLRSLSRLIRLFKLYPSEHQYVRQGVEEALGIYRSAVPPSGLTFGQAENNLLVGDRTFSKVPPAVLDLLGMLREQAVDSVELQAGATPEEVLAFARLLGLRPGAEAPADLPFRSLAELPHIRVNAVKYRRITAAQEVVAKGARPGGATDEAVLAEALLHDTSGDTIEEALLENLIEFNPGGLGRAIHKAASQAGAGAAASRSLAVRMLERAARKVLKSGGGPPEVRAKVAEVLQGLPPESAQTIAGGEDPARAADALVQRFGAGFRGRLLAAELRKELAFSELEAEADRLLAEGEDPRFLLEEASRALAKDGLPLREATPYVLDLMELDRRRRREEVRGLADPPTGAAKRFRNEAKPLAVVGTPGYQEFFQPLLEELKYKAAIVASGDQLLETVRKDAPALVVMDLKIPGMHGADVLRHLRRENLTPPLLLLLDSRSLADDLDVKAYPRQASLRKPPNREAAVRAIQELTAAKAAPKEEDEAPEPERHFSAGLAKLLEGASLKEVPPVPGFEIGIEARFEAGSEAAVVDAFRLASDRPGILLASRSGTDADGVGLLRQFQTAVRISGPWASTGKAALVQAAGLLGNDPIRESPVSAQTLIPDPLGGEIRVCTAGAPFPLRFLAASKKVRKVGSVGVALGGLMRGGLGRVIEEERVVLDPNDILLFPSWGILKATNPKGEPFGVESLGGLLLTASSAIPSAIAQRVLQGAQRHAAGRSMGAVAVVALRRNPAAPGPATEAKPGK
ncbi:MAG: response regulator [Planctomycetes bacterium]|nr:response regulator [Planctomycetota bacterium]